MKSIALLTLFATAVFGQYTGPTNQAGLDLIKEFEGWYPDFYIDPVGIRTIGFGHGCHVFDCSVPLNGKYNVPLTLANGQALLSDDLTGSYEGCVRNNVRYSGLNANQYSALVSFTFNLGCGNLQSSTLLSLLNSGDVYGASEEFGKWVYGGGVVLPGLVRRREAERVLFCSGGVCGSSGGKCTGVSTDSLNIRAEPNTSSAIVGGLAVGASVNIGSRASGTNVSGNPYWFHVGNGYVSAFYVQITSSNGEAWCSTS